MKKIGEVSKLAGVSIRTLRYYDEIGLLKPQIVESNYRMYDDASIERLWNILNYKSLDFSLSEIKDLLDDKSINKEQILFLQKIKIEDKIDFYKNMLLALEKVNMDGFKEKMFSQTHGAIVTKASELLLNREVIKYITLKKIVFVLIEEDDNLDNINEIMTELRERGIISVGLYSDKINKPNINGFQHFINIKSYSIEMLQNVTDYIYQNEKRDIVNDEFAGIEVDIGDMVEMFKMDDAKCNFEFECIDISLYDDNDKKRFELFVKCIFDDLKQRNLLMQTAFLFYHDDGRLKLDDVFWSTTLFKQKIQDNYDMLFSIKFEPENKKNSISVIYTTCENK